MQQGGGRRDTALEDFPGDAHVDLGHVLRVAVDGRGEDQWIEVQAPGFGRRRLQRQDVASHHPVLHLREGRVVLLEGFPGGVCSTAGPFLQIPQHGIGNRVPDAVLSQDFQTIFEAGWIGHGGSRGDAAQVVPDHVGEEKGNHLGAVGVPQQAASLEAAQVLPNGVDLVNVGARVQKDRGGALLVGERDARDRAGCQGRAASRDEHQEKVLGRQVPVQEIQDPGRGGNAVLIRLGMSGLQHPGFVQDSAVPVLDHHQAPAQTVSQDLLDSGGHGDGGLPGAGPERSCGTPSAGRRGRLRVSVSPSRDKESRTTWPGSTAARAAR